MQQFATNEIDTHPLLILWFAAQRPQQHFLLRCQPGRFDSVAAQVTMLGAPPVRLCRFPGSLQLPPDKRGTLLLNDVDALFSRAVDAGAAVVMPVADQFWGDRYGILSDPYGHRWSIASRIEDLSPRALQQRAADWTKDHQS